jgi:hypothetical protein
VKLPGIYSEIADERQRQDAMWGPQNHLDGTGGREREHLASMARHYCNTNFKQGSGTWRDILNEETCEAFAESDPLKLRRELVQVAAVCVAWLEAIDRRLVNGTPDE